MNLQLDFNPSLTKLYRNIAKFSNISVPEEVIDKLIITLIPSKALSNQNDADTINTTSTLIEALVRLVVGDNDNSDKSNIIRDILYKMIAKERMPGIDWVAIEEYYTMASMEAERRMLQNAESES